jgi:hypothetical protein
MEMNEPGTVFDENVPTSDNAPFEIPSKKRKLRMGSRKSLSHLDLESEKPIKTIKSESQSRRLSVRSERKVAYEELSTDEEFM